MSDKANLIIGTISAIGFSVFCFWVAYQLYLLEELNILTLILCLAPSGIFLSLFALLGGGDE